MNKDTKDINGGGLRQIQVIQVFVQAINSLLAKNLIGANYMML